MACWPMAFCWSELTSIGKWITEKVPREPGSAGSVHARISTQQLASEINSEYARHEPATIKTIINLLVSINNKRLRLDWCQRSQPPYCSLRPCAMESCQQMVAHSVLNTHPKVLNSRRVVSCAETVAKVCPHFRKSSTLCGSFVAVDRRARVWKGRGSANQFFYVVRLRMIVISWDRVGLSRD